MSIEEVARRARLSVRGVRGIEAGAEPKADTLGRLAAALGVKVDAFFVARQAPYASRSAVPPPPSAPIVKRAFRSLPDATSVCGSTSGSKRKEN